MTGEQTTESKLAIGIILARQFYEQFEITRVNQIRGVENPPDGISKISDYGKVKGLMRRSIYGTALTEWLDREIFLQLSTSRE